MQNQLVKCKRWSEPSGRIYLLAEVESIGVEEWFGKLHQVRQFFSEFGILFRPKEHGGREAGEAIVLDRSGLQELIENG